MSILETSQIIFNFVMSIGVVIITVLLCILFLNIIKFSKSVKKLIEDIDKESSEIYQKINKFLESIFTLSFVSKFFKKKKGK